jgi:hypothetical protein
LNNCVDKAIFGHKTDDPQSGWFAENVSSLVYDDFSLVEEDAFGAKLREMYQVQEWEMGSNFSVQEPSFETREREWRVVSFSALLRLANSSLWTFRVDLTSGLAGELNTTTAGNDTSIDVVEQARSDAPFPDSNTSDSDSDSTNSSSPTGPPSIVIDDLPASPEHRVILALRVDGKLVALEQSKFHQLNVTSLRLNLSRGLHSFDIFIYEQVIEEVDGPTVVVEEALPFWKKSGEDDFSPIAMENFVCSGQLTPRFAMLGISSSNSTSEGFPGWGIVLIVIAALLLLVAIAMLARKRGSSQNAPQANSGIPPSQPPPPLSTVPQEANGRQIGIIPEEETPLVVP